ncbi:MAG: biotin/lipoyl-binding protein [Propionibacteriaceae bacterium]|jgi:macrolide-specific efflux system membrane fusion protein|nr:biotin/lipoyl-binding protein [Propionibacteriaceae bacterium]
MSDTSTQAPVATQPRRKRRRWLRWAIPVAAVVIIGGVVTGVLLYRNASATPAVTTITRDVQASTVTMTESVSTTGTIEPQQQADLAFSSGGTVTAVNVSVGDKVVAGQALASIDTTDLQAAVDSAQAAVDAAQSDYNDAVDAGVDAQITAAKSTLAAKQNTLTNAQTSLGAATLTAPFDGTVAVVDLAVGDSVGSSGGSGGSGGNSMSQSNSSNSSSSSSSSKITLITANLYSVTTSVGASDVMSVVKGQAVEVTPNGASAALKGTVTSVGLIASSSSSSGATFPVTIDITDPQDGLYSGVSAAVTIITSSRDVLAVPTAAITMSPDGATVELKNADGTTTTTSVTTGQAAKSETEITAGLSEGDTVVVTIELGGNASSSNSSGLSGLFGGGQRPSGTRTFGGGQMPSGFQTDFAGGQPPDFSGQQGTTTGGR